MKTLDQKLTSKKKHLSFMAVCLCSAIFFNDSPSWGMDDVGEEDKGTKRPATTELIREAQGPAKKQRVELDAQPVEEVVVVNQGYGQRFLNRVGRVFGYYNEANELAAHREDLVARIVPNEEFDESMEEEDAAAVVTALSVKHDESKEVEDKVQQVSVQEATPIAVGRAVSYKTEKDSLAANEDPIMNIQRQDIGYVQEVIGQHDLANYNNHLAYGYQDEDLRRIMTRLQMQNREPVQVENLNAPNVQNNNPRAVAKIVLNEEITDLMNIDNAAPVTNTVQSTPQQIEAQPLEAERVAQQAAALEQNRLEAERVAQQAAALEQNRLEAERVAQQAAALEQERLEAERIIQQAAALEQERLEAERIIQQAAVLEQNRLEAERVAQQAAALEQNRLEAERVAQQAAVQHPAGELYRAFPGNPLLRLEGRIVNEQNIELNILPREIGTFFLPEIPGWMFPHILNKTMPVGH